MADSRSYLELVIRLKKKKQKRDRQFTNCFLLLVAKYKNISEVIVNYNDL